MTERVRRLARQVAREIVEDRGFRAFVREVILHVLVEQEEQRDLGMVRSFLKEIEARGMRVRLDEHDRLLFTNGGRLGADLRAVLTLYREKIVAHLARVRDLEEKARERFDKASKPPAPNGQATLPLRKP